MPLISIIVPVYAVERYLHRCVNSILNQSFTDFELILIDDGSPDLCGHICDDFANGDERIHVLHQRNLGLSAARNSGIEWALTQSDSEWLTFIDSDDWVHPYYLEFLLKASQGAEIAISTRCYTHGEELPAVNQCTVTNIDTDELYLQNMSTAITAWGKLFRKSLFLTLRFPPGKLHEDEFIIYKILFKYQSIPVIQEPLYAHLINPKGISRSKWSRARLAVLDAMEEQIDYFLSIGLPHVAKKRLSDLIWQNRHQQELIQQSALSSQEKTDLISHLKRQLRRLLRNHRNMINIRERGENIWIYSNLFPIVHYPHMLWRFLKKAMQSHRLIP